MTSVTPAAGEDRLRRPATPRVRVVADFPPLIRVLRSLLEEEGFAVDVIGTTRPATELAACDLLVVDVKRPDDPVLAGTCESCHHARPVPVLVLGPPAAAPTRPGDRAEWLVKPFDVGVLLDRVRALLSPGGAHPSFNEPL